MSADADLPVRLRAGSPGLGQASKEEVEQRAAELAASDGRDDFTKSDLDRAAEELSGGGAPPGVPETDAVTGQITEWDEPPQNSGHRVEPVPVEDEAKVEQKLVQDGMSEAEHDLRTAAEEGDE